MSTSRAHSTIHTDQLDRNHRLVCAIVPRLGPRELLHPPCLYRRTCLPLHGLTYFSTAGPNQRLQGTCATWQGCTFVQDSLHASFSHLCHTHTQPEAEIMQQAPSLRASPSTALPLLPSNNSPISLAVASCRHTRELVVPRRPNHQTCSLSRPFFAILPKHL